MEDLGEIIAPYAGQSGMVLVALQEIQTRIGYVPETAIEKLATALAVPTGEVLGVISFYSELRTTPPGRHRVCVCNGDSCAATGSRNIAQAVETQLGVTPHTITTDGQFTYDIVYCLGNCALSPSVAVDDEVYGKCTSERVAQLLQKVTDA